MKTIFSILLLAFIVRWTAVETYLSGCPSPAPFTDAYGITHYPTNVNLLACYANSKKPMDKRFYTEEEADKFIKGMPINNGYFSRDGYVDNVEKIKLEDAK